MHHSRLLKINKKPVASLSIPHTHTHKHNLHAWESLLLALVQTFAQTARQSRAQITLHSLSFSFAFALPFDSSLPLSPLSLSLHGSLAFAHASLRSAQRRFSDSREFEPWSACVSECAMNTRDRQFWTEFLLLYRSLPAVWKVKSPEYSSRALKTAGYDQLVIKLREVEPHADRALVVKKINSFRTNFRRDLRKRAEGEESGFESTLWYFELLGFLEGQEESEEGFVSLTRFLTQQYFSSVSSFSDSISLSLSIQRYDELRSKRRRTVIKDESPPTPSAIRSSSPITPVSPYARLSESEALAHTWRSQYDELVPRQKLLARKIISDVLYFGCMDQLQPRHVAQLQQMIMLVKNNEESDTIYGECQAESNEVR